MSATCSIMKSAFGDYLRDALPAPQRKMLRDHLAACPDCRVAAAASDPTFRFARPVHDEVSETERERILSSVRTGVDLLRAERRIGGRSRRVRIGSAAAAAVAALALLTPAWGVLRSRALPVADVAASVPERLLSPVPESSPAAAAVQPAGFSEGSLPPPSEATVYDLNPGAGREEPRVVWIVDRGLDI